MRRKDDLLIGSDEEHDPTKAAAYRNEIQGVLG